MQPFEFIEGYVAKPLVSGLDPPQRFRGALTVIEQGVVEIEQDRAGQSHADQFTGLVKLVGAGLTDPVVRAVEFTHRFDDADAFWTDLMTGTVRSRAMIRAQPPECRGEELAGRERVSHADRWSGRGRGRPRRREPYAVS